MAYKLAINEAAEKEWNKLDGPIKDQFRRKLRERLENPRVESARLSGMRDCYKIKLLAAGYRLVYRVHYDIVVVVEVITVGKRENGKAYAVARIRL